MLNDPHELWGKYVEDRNSESKEKLIIHYAVLVKKIANKISHYLPEHFSKEDLNSYGVFGLIDAIERFNPALGIKFVSFASKRIRGAMIDGIRKEDWVPVNVRKKAREIEQAYQKLEMLCEGNISDEEIAKELNITLPELSRWFNSIQYVNVLSLHEPINEEGASVLADNVQDKISPNPEELIEKKEIIAVLTKAIDELPEKEKKVVSLYYYNDRSNKEIAEILELSDSRISQLHTKAILRLRGKLSRIKKEGLK